MGIASVSQPGWLHDAAVAVSVRVAISWRTAGIGAVLWQAVRSVVTHGSVAYGEVSDSDTRALAVVDRWGFSVYQHHIESTLSLDERPPATRPVPDDVSIRFLQSLQGIDDDTLDTMLRAADTSPEAAETGVLGLSELAAMPGSFAVVADVDGTPVGFSAAVQSGSSGWVLMTATSPSSRRHGIGRAVKDALHLRLPTGRAAVAKAEAASSRSAVARLARLRPTAPD